MQTRFFKLTSLFLVLVLLVNMLPMSVFAQELQTQQQSAGETAAPPGSTEATEAYVVEEVREKRTEFSKEFLLSNGLHMATVYADAVHYETDSGWEEIDNTLKTNRDGTLSNTAGVWEVRLPGQLGGNSPITVEKDGHTLSFRLVGELEAGKAELTRSLGTAETETFSLSQTKTASAQIREVDLSAMEEAVEYPEMVPQKNRSQVAYTGVYDNTDILYDLEANRVKESIVLKSYSQSLRGYRYALEVGTMVPVLEESGQITFYDAQRKNVVMVMPAPFLVDGAGVHCDDVRVTLTGSGSSYTMTYLLPQQWLAAADRAWPVVLDPVVEANMAASNIEDQTICEKTSLSHTWGMMEAGYYSTQGKTRFLVKYKNLPTMTSADVVMGAWFTLYKPQSSSTASEIDVHKLTGSWNSQTVTWANAPDYNGTVEDYELVQAEDCYTWEVTDIVQDWYATNNYGMLFKATNAVEAAATNNYKQFYSSDYGSDWSKPILQIVFRNNNGLSGYWDYTTVSAGAAGSGHINNYTGNLVWVREDIGIGGNRMPVTVSHVYNANDKENNTFGMGYGWRTNFNQLMYVWSEDDDYYVWEDEDGTDRYFTMEDGKLQDEDGQGLELTVNSSGTTKYIITDKQGNTWHFDTQGRLVKIQNNQQTKSSITVTYTSATSKRIKTVTDGVNRVYQFVYDDSSDLLTQISFEGKDDMEQPIQINFGYVSDHLISVTDPEGNVCRYVYNNKLLNNVKDVDSYVVSITYNTVSGSFQPYRVKAVSESHNSEAGGGLSFTYAHNQTTVTDHKGNVQIMQFNNMGNTVSIQDDEGKASFVEYAKNDPENTTERANQMTAASKLQDTVDNEFRDGSFEFGDFWGRTTSEDLENVSTTTVVYHGDKALKMSRSADGALRALQSPDVTAQPGETVTISIYVKTEAGKVSLIATDTDGTLQYSGDSLEANQDWTRLQVSYENTTSSEKSVIARLQTTQAGVTYLDCAQGEKTVTASRFNLISNGDFHSGGPFAWTKGSSAESQPVLDESAISKLDGKMAQLPGSATAQRSLYQTVKVKGAAGDSFVLAGWAKADSAPMKAELDTRGRAFAIKAKFNYTDGTESEDIYAHFNPDVGVWQYTAAPLVAKGAYSSITVTLLYNYNVNTAYFDGIQLFKESFGSSYTYDDEGNVLSVTDLQKQITEYEYNANNDLVEVIQDGRSKLTYTYDDHHNVKTAQTEEELVYSFTYDAYGNNLTVSAGSGESKITASATYSTDGNRCESVTDAAGNVTQYGYNENTNVLDWVRLPEDDENSRTEYTYDSMLRMAGAACTTDTGLDMSVDYTYEDGLLSTLTTPTTIYNFNYGNFGLRDSITAGGQTLASYIYTDDRNHYLERLDYENEDSVEYTYDNKGRLTTEVYEDGATVEYAYNSEGELAQVKDSDSGITRKFFYDLTRRMGEYTEVGTGLQNRVRYTYDAKGNFSELRQEINGTTRVTSYDYDDDNRVTGHTSGTDGKSFAYDDWGRLSGTASTNSSGAVVENSYAYQGNGINTTGQVASMTVDAAGYDVTYSYTYDANGNILTVTEHTGEDETATTTTSYEYDSANQLVRENNQKENFTHVWAYDNAGNILSRKEYAYTTDETDELGTPTDTILYGYRTEGWRDVLTSYDGQTIVSDEIGNITDDGNRTYTWKNGRELDTVTDDGTTWSMTYDADGLRTKRTNGTYTYDYSYIDGQLWYMKANNQELFISWDAAGNPWTLRTGGQTYYYVTNLQGDVTAILSGSGDPMVTYTYDAWGNILSIGGEDANTLGKTNPLRYRGYVYDQETGLYYVSSRYYDPEIGRWINADDTAYLGADGTLLSYNLFAYCKNNPVMGYDPTGHFGLVGAIIATGAIVGGLLGAFSAATTGGNVLESAIEGCLTGALGAACGLAYTNPLTAALVAGVGGAIVDVGTQVVTQYLTTKKVDVTEIDPWRAVKAGLQTGVGAAIPAFGDATKKAVDAFGTALMWAEASTMIVCADVIVTNTIAAVQSSSKGTSRNCRGKSILEREMLLS